MLKCLKTGLHFHVGNTVYHCDMHGDDTHKFIILKGFAPQPDEYLGGYHAMWDEQKDAIVPTEKFTQFMKDWNAEFTGWETWEWVIDDTYCRFHGRNRNPKV